MVAKGQFLERPTLIPSGKVVLEALWHRGTHRPPLLILPPLPDEGGGMDHIVAAETAWAAAMAGFPSLRFNFRGAGASQGKTEGLESCVADVAAATVVLSENAGTPRTARLCIGKSALAALEDREGEVAGLCLVSPANVPLKVFKGIGVPLLAIWGERDVRIEARSLSAAIQAAGGSCVVIPAADGAFLRNLTEVGRAVVLWLQSLT